MAGTEIGTLDNLLPAFSVSRDTLALMHRIDALHLSYTFVGRRR
jgi:hypothetical protein